MAALVMLAAAVQASAQSCDIHVDTTASGAGDGSSWSDAYAHFQDALDMANASGGTDFVLCVATGVYRPDEDADGDHVDDDVTENFSFEADNLEVYGGYPSGGGARDAAANPTVLSGDIDENDSVNSIGVTVSAADISGSNAHHVIQLIGDDGTPITAATRIEGVYITAGDSSFGTSGNIEGGGVQCNISGSSAACSPRVVDVVFQGNAAYSGGGANFVAGNGAETSPAFYNTVFRNNSSANVGAGIQVSTGDSGTTASPLFVNVLFSGNKLDEAYRGGAYSGSELRPHFVNTVFVNNNDDVSVYNYESSNGSVNEPVFDNTILWSNAGAITDNGATSTVNNSIVQSGWSGAGSGNLNQDPKFVDADGPDDVAGTADDDVRLQPGSSSGGPSPAIDAGNNSALPSDVVDLDDDGDFSEPVPVDLYGNPRVSEIDSLTVDMGVYELVDEVFADRFES